MLDFSNFEGTCSHGTLRSEDLAPAFLDLAEEVLAEGYGTADDRDMLATLQADYASLTTHDDACCAEGTCACDEGDCSDECVCFDNVVTRHGYENDVGGLHSIVEDVTELLEGLAPAGWYFGSLEGDGSDFGFWFEGDGDADDDDAD